jgi:hypothetical protein
MAMTSPVVTATSDILASHHNTLRYDVIRNAGIYAVTAGTGSAYTLSIDSAYNSYIAGDKITCKIHEINTLGATMNVNSIGTLNIIGYDGNPILPGILLKDHVADFIYNGTSLLYVGVDTNPDIWTISVGVITYTDNTSIHSEKISFTTIRLVKNGSRMYNNGNLQEIIHTSIWASSDSCTSTMIVGGYIYVYLVDTGVESRIYRCLVTANISNAANWEQITISGYALSNASTDELVGHDGTNFYIVDSAGFNKFTLSGTTFTFVSTITVTGANYGVNQRNRVNHTGIYASFSSAPYIRFASLAGVLDSSRQCNTGLAQVACTKNAFYVTIVSGTLSRTFL